jgi:hypothetical protein
MIGVLEIVLGLPVLILGWRMFQCKLCWCLVSSMASVAVLSIFAFIEAGQIVAQLVTPLGWLSQVQNLDGREFFGFLAALYTSWTIHFVYFAPMSRWATCSWGFYVAAVFMIRFTPLEAKPLGRLSRAKKENHELTSLFV